jgi:hypothetical protein
MLKYNIRKRKHWVQPFFCDNLKWSAYIVSKELNQVPNSFISWEIHYQVKSILFRRLDVVCHICQALAQLTAQKQNQQHHQLFIPSKEANESQKHDRTADTRTLRGNATVRRLDCSVAWELFLSLPRVALRLRCRFLNLCCLIQFHVFNLQSDNDSRNSRLRCGCQVSWCDLFLNTCCRFKAVSSCRILRRW